MTRSRLSSDAGSCELDVIAARSSDWVQLTARRVRIAPAQSRPYRAPLMTPPISRKLGKLLVRGPFRRATLRVYSPWPLAWASPPAGPSPLRSRFCQLRHALAEPRIVAPSQGSGARWPSRDSRER